MRSSGGLAEDLVVRMEVQGGGEGPDVSNECGVLERWRARRQEGQLPRFTVGGGGTVGAVLRRVVLLPATADHLTQQTESSVTGSDALAHLACLVTERTLTCTLSFLLLFLWSRNHETRSSRVSSFRASICRAHRRAENHKAAAVSRTAPEPSPGPQVLARHPRSPPSAAS